MLTFDSKAASYQQHSVRGPLKLLCVAGRLSITETGFGHRGMGMRLSTVGHATVSPCDTRHGNGGRYEYREQDA